jgi:REP element-mobilizing transposase RayT
MARPLRYVPPRALVEVTTRTIQGRFLLRPSRDLNDIVCGILARAARLYDVEVVAFVFLSNHAHLLVVPSDALALARFMNYLNGNLAREAGRLHHWRDKFWARRYRPIPVSDEPEAQLQRLRYILEQGCKERLVRSPRDWPGASSTEALLTGATICGLWFDRTAEYRARLNGQSFSKYEHTEEEQLSLSPLPCWRDRPSEETRDQIEVMVREIEAATREVCAQDGRNPMGKKRILSQHPHDRPRRSKRSSAPLFHAASRGARKTLEIAYYVFRLAFREAVEDLRAGRRPEFPRGSFPPGLPFVPHRAPPLPCR